MIEVKPIRASDIRLKGMIYGDPGAGKTKLAGSAEDHPEMTPILYLNIDGGYLTIADRVTISKIDVTATKQIEEAHWEIANSKSTGKGRFADLKTVILDNDTELQSINLEEIVRADIANSDRNESTINEIYQGNYGTSNNELKRIHRWYRQLDVNFLVIAHSKKVFPKNAKGRPNENSEPIAVLPALTEKLGTAVMGYMDFVWYMYFDPGEEGTESSYNLLTRTAGIYFAKTRGERWPHMLGQTRNVPEHAAMREIYDTYLKSLVPPSKKAPPTKKR